MFLVFQEGKNARWQLFFLNIDDNFDCSCYLYYFFFISKLSLDIKIKLSMHTEFVYMNFYINRSMGSIFEEEKT